MVVMSLFAGLSVDTYELLWKLANIGVPIFTFFMGFVIGRGNNEKEK